MIKSLGWDDWLILLALASFICQASFLIHLAWIEKHLNLTYIRPLANALEVGNMAQTRCDIADRRINSLWFWNLHSTS